MVRKIFVSCYCSCLFASCHISEFACFCIIGHKQITFIQVLRPLGAIGLPSSSFSRSRFCVSTADIYSCPAKERVAFHSLSFPHRNTRIDVKSVFSVNDCILMNRCLSIILEPADMSRRRLILRAVHSLQLYIIRCEVDSRMDLIRRSCARLRIGNSINIIRIVRVDPLTYNNLRIRLKYREISTGIHLSRGVLVSVSVPCLNYPILKLLRIIFRSCCSTCDRSCRVHIFRIIGRRVFSGRSGVINHTNAISTQNDCSPASKQL